MPRFIIKVDRDRDAYLEWSTVVEAPVAIGSRAAFAAEHGEVRLARTDRQGTSAMYYDWLPPTQQEGGWDDAAGLIYMQAVLAAPDDAFRVYTHTGVHCVRHIEVLQEGSES